MQYYQDVPGHPNISIRKQGEACIGCKSFRNNLTPLILIGGVKVILKISLLDNSFGRPT